jgi:transposase InsO family protein
MSAKGNCYDNATCESFFASLKDEAFPDGGRFDSKHQARLTIFENLETFYNRERRHSSLGNIPPEQFLKQHSLNQTQHQN